MRKPNHTFTIFRRELQSYFNSPVAYVFLVAFLLLTGFLTFMAGYYYERRVADLRQSFFIWHIWVYLLLIPAATMGSWAEERRTGTIELLLTMPITLWQAVLGKFLAAWLFIAIALALTFPIVITTAILGDPDMGVIATAYLGSLLMAGAYVAVGTLASATTKSQVISFVIALAACLLMVLGSLPPVTQMLKWLPTYIVDGIAYASFWYHFESLKRGVIDLKDIVYYASVITFALFATRVVLDNRKSS